MALAAAPEVVANDLGEYLSAWGRRIRNGESGVVPVLHRPGRDHHLLRDRELEVPGLAGNLVNLFTQAALFIMFGAAEFYALILSEIDLSLGYLAGVCAIVMAELIAQPTVGFPWWLALICGLGRGCVRLRLRPGHADHAPRVCRRSW